MQSPPLSSPPAASQVPTSNSPSFLPPTPPLPSLNPTPLPSSSHFPLIPLLVVILAISLGALFFVSRRPTSPTTTSTPTVTPTPLASEDNPFTDTNIPEDNPFDSVNTDGSVYQNPFDIMEQTSTETNTNNSTNPFTPLR